MTPYRRLGEPWKVLGGEGGVLGASKGGAPSFLPSDIDGLELWVSADVGTFSDVGGTIPAVADGATIGAWGDRSGNGRNPVQAAGAKQPTLRLNIQNSLPIVRFDGADDLLQVLFALNQPEQAFIVTINRGLANTEGVFDGSINNRMLMFVNIASMDLFAGAVLTGFPVPIPGTAYMATCLFNGAASSVSLNSGAPSVGNVGVANAGGVALGGRGGDAFWGPSDIAEFLVYSVALTADEVDQVETYLNDKWAVF
jgi:hypothetical protein